MADQTVTPIGPAAFEASFIRGIRSCVSMLEGTCDADEFYLQGTYRYGAPQNNVVRRALDEIMKRGDEIELTGFCAALTEVIRSRTMPATTRESSANTQTTASGCCGEGIERSWPMADENRAQTDGDSIDPVVARLFARKFPTVTLTQLTVLRMRPYGTSTAILTLSHLKARKRTYCGWDCSKAI
jgi:hypothetical protein